MPTESQTFGAGIYLLFSIWLTTILLCIFSIRTGHSIGKISICISLAVTVIVILLPRRDETFFEGTNFYDKLFILRYVILSLLTLSAIGGLIGLFVYVCVVPVETKKLRNWAQ